MTQGKKFRVHGFCLVPVEGLIEVEAENADEALAKAQAAFKADRRAVLVSGSADEGAAFDWQPTAEPI